MKISERITPNPEDAKKVHVVSFSGGRTSAYLVAFMEMMRKTFGWEVHYIFMDTGAEHPKTYEFIKKIVKKWGIEITLLRAKVIDELGQGTTYREISMDELKPDLQPWIDMIKKYGLPTINAPRCTSRMKTEPHDKYCDERWGRGNYETWLGIRIDEPKRLKHWSPTPDLFGQPNPPKRPIRYLAELSKYGKQNILDWWKSQAFDLNLPEYLGNCVFCIKKALPKLIAAAIAERKMGEQFCETLKRDDVRILESNAIQGQEIYRNYISMDKILKQALLSNLDDIEEIIEGNYTFEEDEDTLCAESCEIFSDEFELKFMEYQAA